MTSTLPERPLDDRIYALLLAAGAIVGGAAGYRFNGAIGAVYAAAIAAAMASLVVYPIGTRWSRYQ